jgi:hypothetical protein
MTWVLTAVPAGDKYLRIRLTQLPYWTRALKSVLVGCRMTYTGNHWRAESCQKPRQRPFRASLRRCKVTLE